MIDRPHVLERERIRKQMAALSRGGDVVRFHTRPQAQPQNVAAHSYGVVWLCWLLSEERPRMELLWAAVIHDTPEFVVGDMPGPMKQRLDSNELVHLEAEVLDEARLAQPELSEEEEHILKLADYLEGMRHCIKERQLGNQLIRTCYGRYRQAAQAMLRTSREQYIWLLMDQQWEKADYGT